MLGKDYEGWGRTLETQKAMRHQARRQLVKPLQDPTDTPPTPARCEAVLVV